jgi:hypothetical protein
MKSLNLIALSITAGLLAVTAARAEVVEHRINSANLSIDVRDEAWQPEGFENGIVIPAVFLPEDEIVLDGRDIEAAWDRTLEIEVPLQHGTTESATVKALYTDRDVLIRVRWADETENREHRPWVWDTGQDQYVAGSEVEDSVILSFEAGCDWNPSLLSGYIYDFDGWHWMAARSDPLGQAVDLNGHLQDQDLDGKTFHAYQARTEEDTWNVKFVENVDVDLHAKWDELDREYLLKPFAETVYYQARPDALGLTQPPAFFEQVEPPAIAPDDTSERFPQFSPVKLTGGAGEVSARGHWEDGHWTVEFRRARLTPARHANDTIFQRLTQFSIHFFDQTERVDESSESSRLFLQFLPPETLLADD